MEVVEALRERERERVLPLRMRDEGLNQFKKERKKNYYFYGWTMKLRTKNWLRKHKKCVL